MFKSNFLSISAFFDHPEVNKALTWEMIEKVIKKLDHDKDAKNLLEDMLTNKKYDYSDIKPANYIWANISENFGELSQKSVIYFNSLVYPICDKTKFEHYELRRKVNVYLTGESINLANSIIRSLRQCFAYADNKVLEDINPPESEVIDTTYSDLKYLIEDLENKDFQWLKKTIENIKQVQSILRLDGIEVDQCKLLLNLLCDSLEVIDHDWEVKSLLGEIVY